MKITRIIHLIRCEHLYHLISYGMIIAFLLVQDWRCGEVSMTGLIVSRMGTCMIEVKNL